MAENQAVCYDGEEATAFMLGFAGRSCAEQFQSCDEALRAGRVPARTIAHAIDRPARIVRYLRADLIAWAREADQA